MAKVSFNQFLKLQNMTPDSDIRNLAQKWETRKGRLTMASVEERAAKEYNAPAGVGTRAYSMYLAAIGTPVSPNP